MLKLLLMSSFCCKKKCTGFAVPYRVVANVLFPKQSPRTYLLKRGEFAFCFECAATNIAYSIYHTVDTAIATTKGMQRVHIETNETNTSPSSTMYVCTKWIIKRMEAKESEQKKTHTHERRMRRYSLRAKNMWYVWKTHRAREWWK